MSAMVRLARAMRDAYRLEALEPRVLLSADPVLGAAHAVVMQPVDPYAQSLDGAYDPADALAHHPGQFAHASLPDGWQHWAPNAPEPSPSGSHSFAVDARAFDAGHARTASGFMAGTLHVPLDQAANDAGTLNLTSTANASQGPTMHALAVVTPGGSPAVTSNTTGSLTMTGSDTFEVDIDGTGADLLTVTGTAHLDGLIKVNLVGGTTPTEGQTYTVLKYQALSGSFAEGEGLVSVGNGLYFEIQSDTAIKQINLIAHRLDVPGSYAVNLL